MTRERVVVSVMTALGALLPGRGLAVPSFSRQTNMSCTACHTAYPELTPFGRVFKAGGYTASANDEITEKEGNRNTLELLKSAPLSAQLITDFNVVKHAAPGTKSSDALLPDQLGLFYAGKVASDLGAFLQVTYDGQADHFSMDNTDVRWAHAFTVSGRDLIVGATINNNPTVTDLWNTTPAWGWPYVISGVWPGMGSNAALVDGRLAQAVAGLTAYVLIDETVYLEMGGYSSAALGIPRPYSATNAPTPTINGVAWYWRGAVSHSFGGHDLEIGTFGLAAATYPGGGTPTAPSPLSGPTDNYTDVGVDAQWQYAPGAEHSYSVHAVLIHEWQSLGASAPGVSPDLTTVRVNADAYWGLIGVGAGLFATSSSNSATFGVNSNAGTGGALFELIFRPWQNLNLRAQCTFYDRFDGSTSNIDGTGRNASANNDFTLLAWVPF
jgi:hypothetical protein